MFTAIGLALAVLWAFANPYVLAESAQPALAITIASVLGFVILVGGGAILDRRHKRRAAALARREVEPSDRLAQTMMP